MMMNNFDQESAIKIGWDDYSMDTSMAIVSNFQNVDCIIYQMMMDNFDQEVAIIIGWNDYSMDTSIVIASCF